MQHCFSKSNCVLLLQGKAEESVSDLQSKDIEVRRNAARFIKNAIIGNKTKKKLYTSLGVVRRYTISSAVVVMQWGKPNVM